MNDEKEIEKFNYKICNHVELDKDKILIDFKEININNYNDDDVINLNDWAVKAYDLICSKFSQPKCEHVELDLEYKRGFEDGHAVRFSNIPCLKCGNLNSSTEFSQPKEVKIKLPTGEELNKLVEKYLENTSEDFISCMGCAISILQHIKEINGVKE